jgi:hypothetical protein
MLPGTLSLIFFIIEFIILILVIIFNRDHPFFWSILGLLGLLQLYQLSEWLICIGIDENITGRIAYVIITFLPPLGYYLSTRIVQWKFPDYWIGFAAATAFSLYYLITPNSVDLIDCNPLYAIYEYDLSLYYGIYYIGILVYSIIFLVVHMVWKREKIDRKLSILLLIGYLSFLVPMYLMVLIDSTFISTVTSIMCKYALLLAVTLGIFSFIKPKEKQLKDDIEVVS